MGMIAAVTPATSRPRSVPRSVDLEEIKGIGRIPPFYFFMPNQYRGFEKLGYDILNDLWWDDQEKLLDLVWKEMASDSSEKEIKDGQADGNALPDDLSEALKYFDNALNGNNPHLRVQKKSWTEFSKDWII
ncbi:hypothetical protein ACOMHN_006261 [Nucella lapillus]